MFIYAGQVHRARLKGEEVVVKVQRPGLKGLFDIDLKNLRVSSYIFLKLLLKPFSCLLMMRLLQFDVNHNLFLLLPLTLPCNICFRLFATLNDFH